MQSLPNYKKKISEFTNVSNIKQVNEEMRRKMQQQQNNNNKYIHMTLQQNTASQISKIIKQTKKTN
jgi:hypothetical protein